jgi:hypothetical protein
VTCKAVAYGSLEPLKNAKNNATASEPRVGDHITKINKRSYMEIKSYTFNPDGSIKSVKFGK